MTTDKPNPFGSQEQMMAKLTDMFRQGILEVDDENNKVHQTGWIALRTTDQFQTRFEVPFELYKQAKDKALGTWKERQLRMNQELEKENKDRPVMPSAPVFGQTSVSMPVNPAPRRPRITPAQNNTANGTTSYRPRPQQQTGPKKPYMSKDDQIDANLFGPGRTWYHKKPENSENQ